MKKPLILAVLFFTVTFQALAATDTSDWYSFTGQSAVHRFTIKFPTDWQVFTLDDDRQGIAPKGFKGEEYPVTVQEFEGQSYAQVINYFLENGEELEVEDEIITAPREDLPSKTVIYRADQGDVQREFRLFKRGSLIVAIGRSGEYSDIASAILDSFSFEDEWYQYIDQGEQYSFIFPGAYELKVTNEGAEILDESPFFAVQKYANTTIEEVAEAAVESGQQYLEQTSMTFHGYSKVIEAKYEDDKTDKTFSRIFIEMGNDSYGLTNINLEENFPHSDYYDQYVVEILESFEFFGGGSSVGGDYKNFKDVPDSHPNAPVINELFETGVINGYADGSFKPNGKINRAELTKMIVASQTEPDPKKYKNCFSDVKTEWHAPYICYASEQGWVEGYADGSFRPGDSTNRVEALKIILEVLFDKIPEGKASGKVPDDLDLESWYGKYFIYAWNNDLLDLQHMANNNYQPSAHISRKEVAETIYRSLNLK